MSALLRPFPSPLATVPRAARPLPALVLPVLAALCLLGPASDAGAAPAETWRGPLDHELEFGFGWLVPFEADLDGIYGSIPVLHARLSLSPGARVRFFLGGGYGRTQGDPWYDVPTFVGPDDAAELVIVPLQTGLRLNLVPRDDFRLDLGILFEVVWVRESLPVADYIAGDTERASGWCPGLGVTFGPHWRLRDPAWAVGVEAGLTAGGGSIGHRPTRDIDLSGMTGRVYVSYRI